MDVEVRAYKDVDLGGGTLIVSVPHVGIGGTLLTDFLLEELGMDQVACVDAAFFPPFAMIHQGKPRFPVRIHADPKTRIALLRSEITPLPSWTRPIARAILDWAAQQKIGRIIAPDGVLAPPPKPQKDGARGPNKVWFVATQNPTRSVALAGGLQEFGQGVLGGVPAVLLLEGRFRNADVAAILVQFHDPVDDALTAMGLAQALPLLAPAIKIDLERLKTTLSKIEGVVRALRDEAEEVAKNLNPVSDVKTPMMYG